LTALGVLGLGVFVCQDLSAWMATGSPEQRRYIWQRILFAVATWPEVPFIQVIGAGVVCWLVGKRRRSDGNGSP
jgi:hypothetical protein